MNNIEYTEEEKKVVIATGVLPLNGSISEERQRNIVFKMLEAKGYDLGDKSDLVIDYEIVKDEEFANFTVTRVIKEMVPYKVEMEKLYSDTFVFDPSKMDETAQKRVIFSMMIDSGIEIDPTADYEISYEETENYDKDKTVLFTVYKYNREKIDNAGVFYEEESEIEEIFSGSFILDGSRMTEEEQRDKVMKMMKDAGVEVEDGANIDIGYEGAENFEDGMSTRFVVIKETKKVVPYKIVSEKVYSGEYILDNLNITPVEQREKIFDMMRAEGISVGDKSELDIRYEGADDFEDGMSTKFDVYRLKKVRVDEKGDLIQENTGLSTVDGDSLLKSEVIEVEEIQMEEIVNGTLDLVNLSTQDEIDNKVFEILKVSGVEVGNVGEVKVSYGLETEDKKLPFAVSRVFIEKVKYNVDKELIGIGIKKDKEDIFAAVQRNQGLDIRLDPNYEIVYGENNELGKKYTLIKTKRTELESTLVDTREKEETIDSELDNVADKENSDIISVVDALYDKAKSEVELEDFSDTKKAEADNELDKLRKSLNTIDDILIDNGSVDELLKTLESLENITATATEMTSEFRKTFEDIDSKIKDIRKDLKQAEKDYESAFLRMQELAKEEIEEFEKSGLLSEEEIQEIKERYAKEKLDANEMSLETAMQIEQGKRKLTSLVRRKNKLEKDILKAEALGLSVLEYHDIVENVSKRKIMDDILDSKGLSGIVEKTAKERTADEKQLLIEAKEEIINEVVSKQKGNSSDKSLMDMVEALYATDSKAIVESKARDLVLRKNDLIAIENNSTVLPEKIVNSGTKKNNYTPGYAPKDMVEVNEINAIKEAIEKDEQLERIVVYVDRSHNDAKYVRKHVADRFNLLRNQEVKINNASFYKISVEDEDFLRENASNDYSPYNVAYENVNSEDINSVSKKKNRRRRKKKNNSLVDNSNLNSAEVGNNVNVPLEKIVVYLDLDNNEIYVKKNVFKRFNLEIKDNETKIQNAICHKLTDDDLEYIVGNANNDYSPYDIEYREVHLGKVEVNENEIVPNEVITLYRDANNHNDKYAPSDVLNRFGIDPSGDVLPIDGNDCYQLTDEDENKINNLVENSVNPKIDLNYKDVELDNNKDIEQDDTDFENSSSNEDTENKLEDQETPEKVTLTLYRDLNDNNQIYASINILNMFGIVPSVDSKVINGEDCYQISSGTDRMINYVADTSVNPKYTVKYENVKLKKKVVPHVEAILDKLTTGLEIRAKDAKKFNDSKLNISENFKNELRSGNVLYNVVHSLPATARASFSFLKKLAGSLLSGGRVKTVMTELNRRLDEDLSEEELDVLFEEYRGSQLKTDMNHQINDVILQKLRKHGLEKAANINDKIRNSYTNIFALLGQIKVIDQELLDENLEAETLEALMNERTNLIDMASDFVKDVLICRKDVNNLLSGGVHGLEEDFKAVSTKLSYVGMRFAKTNDFDNELQHKLGEYGEKLNEALSEGDNEEILNNFMGLESCYYKNTKVARSAFGKRSVGSKYYSPLAEQFDYRDDPFIRDMITTVVFANAVGSAINASLVHQFKDQELLRQQNYDATNINMNNDNIIDYVHQTGADIQEKRGVFQDGMEAQAHQDVLSSANMIERSSLDMSNWSFNGAYRAADEAGHSFFNSFNQDVTSQINDITAKYGSGAINQVEAVHQMAKVANDAQSTLVNVSNECSSILKTYTDSHPQFDLSGIQESLDYVVAHPDAISNMNQAMLDVTNLAGGLDGLAVNHVEALASLPSDMASTLVCAASAAGLALHVSKSMAANYGKKGVYGNEITDMMDDYINDSDELSDEEENTRRR